MNIISNAINGAVVVMGVGGILWMAVGIPVGIIWIVSFSRDKNKNSEFPTRNWLWVTMGGMGLLLLAFGIYTMTSI